MSKRKRTVSKKKSGSNWVNLFSYALIGLSLLIAAAGAGYFFGYNDAKSEVAGKYEKEKSATQKMLQKLHDVTTKETVLSTPELQKKTQEFIQKYNLEEKHSAAHEYAPQNGKALPPEGPVRPKKIVSTLPKLAIIIDDVSFARDVRMIKDLKMPITMSFLPPSKNHPDSAKLAAKEPFYMVHLPLEAKNFSATEPSTLYVASSHSEVVERIQNIKQAFPKVRYVNNHTGSTFTADEQAMNRLITVLRNEKISFIDSRTTAETKVPKVMKNFGMPYVARDVFLDHDPELNAIKKQIKRAVSIAKKHGSAIAIGHPHKKTLQALAESRTVLNDVKLVRVNEL
jgi:polysaccharide deacetylase 2 family uncharacterized protein YibQ